jgi:hypothetical protein
MASALEVPASSIVVLAVGAGSVRIDFAILPDANFVPTDGGGGQYAFDPADKLTALAQMVSDDSSYLFANSPTFQALGASTTIPVALPAASQNADLVCVLHLKRLEMCNGQLSAEAVFSDRNCIVALEGAAAAATDCASTPGFANLPSAADLGCNADGTVTDAPVLPDTLMGTAGTCFDVAADAASDAAALLAFGTARSTFQSFSLNELAGNGGADSMDGEAYIVPDFGAHFDGDGDRVQLATGTSYATDDAAAANLGDGAGFAISFWFTKGEFTSNLSLLVSSGSI